MYQTKIKIIQQTSFFVEYILQVPYDIYFIGKVSIYYFANISPNAPQTTNPIPNNA